MNELDLIYDIDALIPAKVINAKVKELLTLNALDLFEKIEIQHQYRNFGISSLSFKELLKVIAEADLKGVDIL